MKHNKEVLLDNTGCRNPLEGVDIGEVYGARSIASLTNLVPIFLFLLCKTLDKPLAVWTYLPRYVLYSTRITHNVINIYIRRVIIIMGIRIILR
jgi:hypothetical protein